MPISQIVSGTDYPYRTGFEHREGLGAASPAPLYGVES